MPSPVAHTLLGLSLGAVWLAPGAGWRGAWRARWFLAGCGILANLPDIDYLPGVLAGDLNHWHHFHTHTAGWCLLVAVGLWCAGRAWRPIRTAALGWLVALLISHLVADWVTEDRRPPRGIMALWPLSDRFYIADHPFFGHLKKDRYADFLQWHNVQAVGWECICCAPFVLAAAAVVLSNRRAAC